MVPLEKKCTRIARITFDLVKRLLNGTMVLSCIEEGSWIPTPFIWPPMLVMSYEEDRKYKKKWFEFIWTLIVECRKKRTYSIHSMYFRIQRRNWTHWNPNYNWYYILSHFFTRFHLFFCFCFYLPTSFHWIVWWWLYDGRVLTLVLLQWRRS